MTSKNAGPLAWRRYWGHWRIRNRVHALGFDPVDQSGKNWQLEKLCRMAWWQGRRAERHANMLKSAHNSEQKQQRYRQLYKGGNQ